MRVKICGITSKEAAKEATEAGADLLGFVFAPSKRQITPEKAASIANTLPSFIKTVGIFVNETVENIKKITKQVNLDFIQLHGDESPSFRKQLPYPVIKAFPATEDNFIKVRNFPCDFYLLDSPKGKSRGGNGTVFDWCILKKFNLDHKKLILAGGLSPKNIQQAIATVHPAIVDVSSGVETNGIKDPVKMKQFIKNAKGETDEHDHIY
ncbi:phosphoribosylanthranilate isomerase [Cerasibacillus terrae]|uniref:N-(5'-phosphoribosyl)anthranilate isomerase n=1 Tax=Cerasibacillus terrae TaxID=2498845 RepID=A0A5C8NSF4_9BACI|nr:phosphoribosylanthranilate isomerase [Cerasibacillus terrae]TXL64066.1 phosphoribosylanthranilate isomerase [Cerasibacillus terrae]